MSFVRLVLLLTSAFSVIEAFPGHQPRSACKTSGLLASLIDGPFVQIASEFCSGYLGPTVLAADTVTKTNTVVITNTNTQLETLYQTEYFTTTNTETAYTTIATALESTTIGTATEVSTTATATNEITSSIETDLSTLSTEKDVSTVTTEFATVYASTEIDTVTLTTTTFLPDKLKARACVPPLCWTECFVASEISSACSCVIKSPSPTKTIYTKTTTLPKTVVQTDIVEATSTIYSTVDNIQSTLAVSTVYITATSIFDVTATTILEVEATTSVDVTATSIEDVTTTTIIDNTFTSTVDEATTATVSTTAVATLSCSDPITNGGFDTGFLSPWTTRGSSYTYTFISPGYNSSAYALAVLFSNTELGSFVLDQSITVCPGITYDYSFRVSIPAASYDYDGSAELDISTSVFGSFNSYSAASAQLFSPTSGYIEFSGSFNAGFADIGIELNFELNSHEHESGNLTLYIDDFVITAMP